MGFSGVPEQSRLDRLVGASRAACGGFGAPGHRLRASAPSSNAMRYRCESRSQPDRRVSTVSEPLACIRRRFPVLHASSKPSFHGLPRWTRSRCREPKSIAQSVAACRSPLSLQLTSKGLIRQAWSRSDRLAHPYAVMSSGSSSCGCRSTCRWNCCCTPPTRKRGPRLARAGAPRAFAGVPVRAGLVLNDGWPIMRQVFCEQDSPRWLAVCSPERLEYARKQRERLKERVHRGLLKQESKIAAAEASRAPLPRSAGWPSKSGRCPSARAAGEAASRCTILFTAPDWVMLL